MKKSKTSTISPNPTTTFELPASQSTLDFSSQIMYAGPDEEFFWVKNDLPVEEGVAVGYEVERFFKSHKMHAIDLVLFEDIYHEFKEVF